MGLDGGVDEGLLYVVLCLKLLYLIVCPDILALEIGHLAAEAGNGIDGHVVWSLVENGNESNTGCIDDAHGNNVAESAAGAADEVIAWPTAEAIKLNKNR